MPHFPDPKARRIDFIDSKMVMPSMVQGRQNFCLAGLLTMEAFIRLMVSSVCFKPQVVCRPFKADEIFARCSSVLLTPLFAALIFCFARSVCFFPVNLLPPLPPTLRFRQSGFFNNSAVTTSASRASNNSLDGNTSSIDFVCRLQNSSIPCFLIQLFTRNPEPA